MNDNEIDQDIRHLIDGEITEEERRRLLACIREDADAYARWNALHDIVEAARRIPRRKAPDNMADTVASCIREREAVSISEPSPEIKYDWRRIAAAACISFILGAGMGWGLAFMYPSYADLVVNPAPEVQVRFVFTQPGTRDVRLVGDFNNWDTNGIPLFDRSNNGVWSTILSLPPGVYQYMYIVDGQTWVTDPTAEAYLDDGFGQRNAVLRVDLPNTG